MIRKADTFLIGGAATIREAFVRLESSGSGLLLLIDAEGRLARTVTDGDLRRPLPAAPMTIFAGGRFHAR